jgi:polar amino acid transport system substrate-binding protein
MKVRHAVTATTLGALALLAAACGGGGNSASGSGAIKCTNSGIQKYLYHKGQLTVATDSPAYSPWFSNNKPQDGKGYESAVAYAVASQLGFSHSQVHWVVEPFNASYAPGPKHFDFDINEISVTKARAKAVTFSTSYYDDHQALVVIKGTPIVTKHSPSELKKYIYGDQVGTTSLQYINTYIRPDHTPSVFNTLNDVKSAMAAGQIAALVTDTPTAQYIATEIPHATLLAQFPSTGEHFGMLFAKGDKLAVCVDKALAKLRSDGFIAKETKRYLRLYTSVPTIKP